MSGVYKPGLQTLVPGTCGQHPQGMPAWDCDCLGVEVQVWKTQFPVLKLLEPLVPVMHLKPTYPGLNPLMAPDEGLRKDQLLICRSELVLWLLGCSLTP